MNKKIISRILLGSTLILTVSSVAANCTLVRKKTNIDQKPTTPPNKMPDSPEERFQKEINDIANKVILDYPEKKNFISDEADIKKVEVSNLDKNKYDIMLKDISFDSENKFIKVTFSIKNKETELISTEISKQIDGFKTPKVSLEKFNEEAKKVTIEYPKKETIAPSKAVEKSFILSGYDANRFKISLTGFTTDDENGRAFVSFKLIDINYPENQSTIKKATSSGFKRPPLTTQKLHSLVSDVKFDYPNKANIYPWEVDVKKIIPTNLDSNTSVTNFKIVGLNSANSNAVVTFVFSDKTNSSIKIDYSTEVSGFKTLSKQHSNLTKTLFIESKKFIQLENNHAKTLALYKELAKSDAEITLNFDSNKIVIPANGKVVNISKKDTFIEVGSLTSDYKTMHNELILGVTKIISETVKLSTTYDFDSISKFFTLPKKDAIKQFNDQKTKFSSAEYVLSKYIYFPANYVENIEKLIKRDNYSVVYNHKTGLFAMQSGEAEIDLNKPETYTAFIGFQKGLKEKITSKIQEILTKYGVDETKINLFLNDGNSNLGYILEKNGDSLISGLKVKQIPSS